MKLTQITFVKVASLFLLTAFGASVHAQTIVPRGLSWADSYSVGGKCYCASTYDHGIGTVRVDTPAGQRTVRQVCEAIGRGPGIGNNPIYNTVQCGHEPAHRDSIRIGGRRVMDEVECPGRTDIGSRGCSVIGPRWDLSVFGSSNNDNDSNNNARGTLNRNGWTLSSNRNSRDLGQAVDGRTSSRWTTRQSQRNGQRFQIDLRSRQRFDRIILDSQQSRNDHPRRFQVQVSNTGRDWITVRSANGSSNGNTVIDFADQNRRHVRIIQVGSDRRQWWSIHEINLVQR